jgi:hypothetical protein
MAFRGPGFVVAPIGGAIGETRDGDTLNSCDGCDGGRAGRARVVVPIVTGGCVSLIPG